MKINRLSALALVTAGLMSLSACTVVVDEPDRRPPRPDPGDFCTAEYRPVCAERGGALREFGNRCEADRRGYRVLGRGSCDRFITPRPWPGQPGYDPGFDGPRPGEPTMCTREYRPVCAVTRGEGLRTFPNRCTAESTGARVVSRGPC